MEGSGGVHTSIVLGCYKRDKQKGHQQNVVESCLMSAGREKERQILLSTSFESSYNL